MTRLSSLRRLWRRSSVSLSRSWLIDQQRRSSRIEFHGVAWTWPVQKDQPAVVHRNLILVRGGRRESAA